MNGFAGRAVPDDDGLALISDADAPDVGRFQICFFKSFNGYVSLAGPNFFGVVFHPTGLRKVLLELALAYGDDLAASIEEDGPGGSGALIDRD
jgi:hypothetical protein